jgi:Ca2+-binding EF-hand superfamily protein
LYNAFIILKEMNSFDVEKVRNLHQQSPEQQMTTFSETNTLVAEYLKESQTITTNLENIWHCFDKDKKGILDRSECETLFKVYIAECIEKIDVLLDLAIEASLAMLSKTFPPNRFKAMEKQMKKKIHDDQVISKICQALGALKDDPEVVQDFMTKLDKDQDGMVSKLDFTDNFILAVQILDERVAKMIGLLLSSSASARSSSSSNAIASASSTSR